MKRLLLVILFFFLLFTSLWLKNSWVEKFSTRSRPALPHLESDKVERIEITHGGKTTALVKREGKFFTEKENFPADPSSVKEILDSLAGLSLDETASVNKEKWSIFEVDDERSIHIKLVTDKESHNLWLGKYGPDYQSVYWRINEDSRTYLSQKNVRNYFARSDFRDLTIVNINRERVNTVELKYQMSGLKIEKGEHEWKSVAAKSEALDSTKVNSLLDKFAPLKGNGLNSPNHQPTANFDFPYLTLTIKTDPETAVIRIGSKNKEGNYFVKTEDQPHVYTLDGYLVENFPKTIKDLQK